MRTLTDGVRHWVPHNRWDLVAPARLGRPQPTVAIIVAYFEQPASLLRMYAALGVAGLDPDRTELVVVDDGSACAPPSPPPDLGICATVLRQDDNGCRPGAARNLGAAQTSADVLVFLDSDTLPEPPTINRLAAWPAIIPDAVVVGRRGHVDLRGWSAEQARKWLTGAGPAPTRRPDPAWLADGYRESHDLLDADDRSFRYVISAVMACHRTLFDDVGGFDALRVTYGGEDWEFAARAFNNGAVLVHDPDAVAWHDEPDWADREHDDDGKKAEETLWLAAQIGDPATRGVGLRQRGADVVVSLELPPQTPVAPVVATMHTVLDALADVSLHLQQPVSELVAEHVRHDPRVRLVPAEDAQRRLARTSLTLRAPVDARPGALQGLVDAVRPCGPGRIDIVDDGRSVGCVVSARAAGRARRAGRFGIDPGQIVDDLFGRATVEASAVGLRILPTGFDLAAWLAASAAQSASAAAATVEI